MKSKDLNAILKGTWNATWDATREATYIAIEHETYSETLGGSLRATSNVGWTETYAATEEFIHEI